MGAQPNDQLEWATVNRLAAMLRDLPETPYNITLTFSLFSSILLWTKERMWVDGNSQLKANASAADIAARDLRVVLGGEQIVADWGLSLRVPPDIDAAYPWPESGQPINSDFNSLSVAETLVWLRDAIAHGDARKIDVIHKRGKPSGKLVICGYYFLKGETKGSNIERELYLYHEDMRDIGLRLADAFCAQMAGSADFWMHDVATRESQLSAN